MALVYLDDKFPTHPRVIEAQRLHPLAPWLFVVGLCYCRQHMTGGDINPASIQHFMPGVDRRTQQKMSTALVGSGLWEVDKECWFHVHDYDEWNTTEDVQRENRKARASRAATVRWERERARRNGSGP